MLVLLLIFVHAKFHGCNSLTFGGIVPQTQRPKFHFWLAKYDGWTERRTNIFQNLIETQSSDEQLDLGVVDSDNDPEYECEGSGSTVSESEIVASTSRSKVRPRSRSRKKLKTTKTPHFFFKS